MFSATDKQAELSFWKNYLPGHHHKFSTHRRLKGYVGELIGNKKSVKIADIGCGAVPLIGTVWPGVKVEYFPSDLLAAEYMDMWRLMNKTPVAAIEIQRMECLAYEEGVFDIVYCGNALDHCISPFESIREMHRVCKRNGWILMRHFPHEAKKLKYTGMHRWNVDLTANKDCIIWNKTQSFLLSECVAGFINQYENPDTRHIKIRSKLKKV